MTALDDKNLMPDNNINDETNNSSILDKATKISQKKKKKDSKDLAEEILTKEVLNPVWLSISECAKIGGIQGKTVRRAIQAHQVEYKIVADRYLVEFSSFIILLYKTKKLKNKLNFHGIGQYIDKWRK